MQAALRIKIALTVIALVLPPPSLWAEEGGAAAYERAVALERQRGPDLEQAARLYSEAAALEHKHARVRLGLLYQNGQGVPADRHRAFELYQEAAEQGDRDGQLLLGMALLAGVGTEPSASEARRWFGKAALAGEQRAQLTLGLMLRQGEGGPSNEMAAGRWFSRAAEGPENTIASRARKLHNEVQRQANTREETDPKLILAGLAALFAIGLLASGTGDGGSTPAAPSDLDKHRRQQECMAQQAHRGLLEAQLYCLWH